MKSMKDRKLLEDAALAAGIKVDWRESVACLCYSDSPYNVAWNPLVDDADAFRLQVKLRITVFGYDNTPPELELPRNCVIAQTTDGRWFAEYAERSDGLASARRAIVRAAASIGERK